MDHSDVVRLQAVEKYVLGELPADLRNQFEEHYFDCSECAKDVESLAAFMTASREVLGGEGASPKAAAEAARGPDRRSWFAWLRPAIAAPAMAALAAVLVFQNVVTIPALREQGRERGAAQAFGASYHLQGATRGENNNASRVTIGPNESFALDFDFTPAVLYQRYTGSLKDHSGSTIMSFPVPGGLANKEMHVVIPGGRVGPGDYDLVFAGENGEPGKDTQSREVQRLSFVVDNRP